jgi:predicted PurR-regulated permease PerM
VAASDYAWRLLVIGAVIYVVYLALLRVELVLIALFLALVFTSVLHPLTDAINRYLPRGLSVLIATIGSLALIAGVFWLVAVSVSDQSASLVNEFRSGLTRIENWLEGPPFHVNRTDASNLQNKIVSYIDQHRSTLISQAVNGASVAVEALTALALALFCAIYFTYSGGRMWRWFTGMVPEGSRPTWDRCGRAAWQSFSGYTRGVIMVSAANAAMVGIALWILHVPLALPLTILEFLASFIPLAGSPIAMSVATLVALAGRGVTTALVVLILIVVFGQIEGHILQPFVMGWSVRLHPVAVAVSVAAGTLIAGLPGAVAAVPLVSIAYAVFRELRTGESPPDAAEDDGTLAADDPTEPDDPDGDGDAAGDAADEADRAGDSDASSEPSDTAGPARGNAVATPPESTADPV